MKLALLVALTMTAFAANSILNKIGVARFGMHPLDFAAIRVAAGALMLSALVGMRNAPRLALHGLRRWAGAAALAVYMLGFSRAYLSLDAGIGALILFGALQVVIFGWSVQTGQNIPALRWLGAIIALLGLCVLLWPTGPTHVPPQGAVSMIAAAIGWAIYTLLGRDESDALGASAANFLLCLPLVVAAAVFGGGGPVTVPGVLVAIVAGAVTSGLGYALWYRVLPALPSTVAATAQLSVPVIAVTGGVVLLGETFSVRLAVAGALVLGGIGVSLRGRL